MNMESIRTPESINSMEAKRPIDVNHLRSFLYGNGELFKQVYCRDFCETTTTCCTKAKSLRVPLNVKEVFQFCKMDIASDKTVLHKTTIGINYLKCISFWSDSSCLALYARWFWENMAFASIWFPDNSWHSWLLPSCLLSY